MTEAPKKLGRLYISRRPGEGVVIYNGEKEIQVTVHRVQGSRVVLEFVSDPTIFNVSRNEAFDQYKASSKMKSGAV